ncbi:elongation factor 1-gamma [Sporothrix brasiliensis 5110]|uniref:Elongation factor 1-gamma n=1 Tax=Sporothrix brasiliensis 5110 TaxID=1398154 RepID=A0A0C2EQQ0_9PEZI|nr:elongation factor 1-gamma [Sporothrix brasiliensis 5110]KIH88659.1 elongation factor 1-gamma [Sporothrix brasiliensis 5110]
MSFGKLYSFLENPRSTGILVVAKANNLDIELVDTLPATAPADYKNINKMGTIPTFVGADGFTLSECIAIYVYVASQNEKTTLLGKTKQDYANILKWMSFFNSEVLPRFGDWYGPLRGLAPYNKKAVDDASKASLKALSVAEEHLLHNTFLVGERITVADIFAASIFARGMQFVFGKAFREEFPNLTRWFTTVYNQPIYSSVAPKAVFNDEPAFINVPPKKEAAPKKEAPKKAAAPKAAAAAEEEEPAAAPKPKHPIDLLPRATFPLDEWKRQYSNSDTPVALKWFWENVKFDEYSIWKVEYKYNDELTMTFMSNNLIGGFNNRLEASRKYLFGCASVYGQNNDSVIEGAFVIRGEDYLPVFDVAPDYESYSFTKLDPTKAEDRAYVEAQWSWDKPVIVNGKEYPHADGKVFK